MHFGRIPLKRLIPVPIVLITDHRVQREQSFVFANKYILAVRAKHITREVLGNQICVIRVLEPEGFTDENEGIWLCHSLQST